MLGKTICWSPCSCSWVLAKWTEILKKLETQVRLKMYLTSVFLVRPNQQLTIQFILKGWQTFCQRRFNWPEFWLAGLRMIWKMRSLDRILKFHYSYLYFPVSRLGPYFQDFYKSRCCWAIRWSVMATCTYLWLAIMTIRNTAKNSFVTWKERRSSVRCWS